MQKDRGKEFLNRPFQDMLKRECFQFHVCRNPDVKCAVAKRAYRTLRNKLYRYFTYKNTLRFVDVLQQFVKAYVTVPTSIGTAPTTVTDRRIFEIWNSMNDKRSRVRLGRIKFQVGQHVRISKEKMKFAKGSEQNYTDEIFRIIKVIPMTPRPVYELEDLNGTLTGQFYGEELTPVPVTKHTVHKIAESSHGVKTYAAHSNTFPPKLPINYGHL